MSANEIAERIAAHAWVQLGPQAGVNLEYLDANLTGFRSQVGFLEVIIASADLEVYPLLILKLDREMSRKQNQVIAYQVGSVDHLGRSYPQPPLGNGPQLPSVQAIHMDWVGDPSAPSWLPFGADVVPDYATRDLDRFNAIAIQLQGDTPGEGDFQAYAGDLCVLVLASPIQESPPLVSATIPVPVTP